MYVVRFLAAASLLFFLAGSSASAQDGAAPQSELKSDVPTDTLSVGNSGEEPETAAPSTSKAPTPETIPPPENAGPETATAPGPQTQTQSQSEPGPEQDAESAETAPEENLKAPAPETAPPSTSAESAPTSGDQGTSLNIEDEDDSSAKEKAETNETRQKICHCHFSSQTSYRDRRTTLGALFGIEVGAYAPVNYQPDFNTNTFEDYYVKKGPNIEFQGGAKLNFFLGSIGPTLSGGFYQASSNDGDTLVLIPLTAGITYALDNLFSEPYVVPYVTAGMYSILYQESQAGLSVKGNSAFSEFYSVGLRFQMDALDPESHDTGYEDFGIENTFLFVEARQFLPANNPVPDFSTPLQISGGFMVEF